MKKRMMVLVLAGFLAGVAFVISCGQEARSIAQEVIKAIEVSFDPAGTDIVATDVQGMGTELAARISALEAKVGTPAIPVVDLSGRVADLEAKIANLQDLGTESDTRIVSLEAKVGTIPIPTSGLSGTVADLAVDVASLKEKDSSLESKFFFYESVTQAQIPNNKIVSLESRTTNLETTASQITVLDVRVTDLETDVSQNQEDITLLFDAVAPATGACLEKARAILQSPANWVAIDQQANATGLVTLDLPCSLSSVRYIEISITRTDDNGQANVREIQVFGPDAPATNLALNKTATAISSQTGPSLAVDGSFDTASRWASDRTNPGPASVSVPHWLMVDLGQNYKVNKVVIDLGDYGAAPFTEDYTLLGKRDGN